MIFIFRRPEGTLDTESLGGNTCVSLRAWSWGARGGVESGYREREPWAGGKAFSGDGLVVNLGQ